MVDFSDITTEIKEALIHVGGDKLRDELLMCIGDPTTGNVYVPISRANRPGLVYVHTPAGQLLELSGAVSDEGGDAPAIAVLPPGRIPPNMVAYGAYVTIQKKGKEFHITGVDATLGNELFYGFKERAQRPVDLSLLNAALIWPTSPSGSSVLVTSFPCVINGIAYYPPTLQSSDLITTYAPSTAGQAKAVMIEVDPNTETLYYTASSAFTNPASNLEPLTAHRSVFTNYPKTVTDSRFLAGWIKLYTGQTSIEIADILPAQEVFNKGGAGGGAGQSVDAEEMAWMGVGTSNLITGKRLADGQLPGSKTTLYTVPASTTTRVSSIILHNTNASDRTVILYAKVNAGTSRIIFYDVLHGHDTIEFTPPSPIIIPAQGVLEGEASVANQVDYYISGGERLTPASGVIVSHLADGQLPSTTGLVYTAPTGKTVTVTSVILESRALDTAPDDELVELWVYAGSGSRYLVRQYLENRRTVHRFPNLILESTVYIEGKADTASRVDFWIDGVIK